MANKIRLFTQKRASLKKEVEYVEGLFVEEDTESPQQIDTRVARARIHRLRELFNAYQSTHDELSILINADDGAPRIMLIFSNVFM